MKRLMTVAAVGFGAVLLAAPGALAQAPAQTPPKQQAQAPKKAKVWTDDNISSVRSSSDVYQDQQASEKAAQQPSSASAQQNPAAAKDANSDAFPIPQAKTTKEADDLIASDKENLQSQQEYIQQTEKELATAPDSYKERLHWRIQARTDVINRLQRDIAALEKQKADLGKPPAPANPGAASQPPSQ
ncbi:MAG TPA: hypothetical protein VKB26_12490 [Candidatus Acidoferrales bacterium]|nr:hypothetical protein [Candidatus Acidoferrales bacterium]